MSKQLSSKKLTDFFKPKPAAPTEAMTPQPPPQPASLRREDSGSSIALPSLPSSQTSTKPRVIPSSDGEESSSDDSDLEDPFKAYAPSRKASFPTPKPPRVKTKRTLSDSPNEKAKPKPAAPPTVYKFSLDQLLEDRAKAQAVEANIRRATELVASAEAPKNHSEQVHNVRSLFTKETAATIMGVNGGSGERLLAAMNREEDWKIEMTWEFFDHRKVNAIPRPFPIEATRDHAVFAVMGDATIREEMFLAGFYADLAAFGEVLPDVVLIWLLGQVCLEPRQDLAFAYLHTLKATGNSPRLLEILTPKKVNDLLELLGVKEELKDFDRQLQLIPRNTDPKCNKGLQNWRLWNIRLFVELLGQLNKDSLKFTCGVLVRIALDERISRQPDILVEIESSFARLLTTIPDQEWEHQSKIVAYSIMSTILLPELRFRILQLLPISSPRLHLFRRRLACAFVFEDASRMTTPYENLLPLGKLATMVERQTPYKIQQSTNYTALRALISILDVAIDNGATAGTVKDKDADVDKITVILKNMFSKILDTNAQNIPRTETKDVIERLQFRLTFAVRSKQKMAMDILGNYEQTKLPFSKKKEMVVSPKTEEEVAVKAEGEDVKMEDVKVDAEI